MTCLNSYYLKLKYADSGLLGCDTMWKQLGGQVSTFWSKLQPLSSGQKSGPRKKRRVKIWGWKSGNRGCERSNGRKQPFKTPTLLRCEYLMQKRYQEEKVDMIF
jgi:hypothetical protein